MSGSVKPVCVGTGWNGKVAHRFLFVIGSYILFNRQLKSGSLGGCLPEENISIEASING